MEKDFGSDGQMMPPYILATDRLGLRRWVAGDEAPFIRMNQDPDVMEFYPRLLTPDESAAMVQRIIAFFEANGHGLYAVEVKTTGEFIGYTGFSRPSFESSFTPCTEIGWRLKKEAWGHGYATEAATACLRHGFGALGLLQLFSFTSVLNIRSERVMQKIGMSRVGQFDHPGLEVGNVLRPHVLYAIEAPAANHQNYYT